MNGEHGPAKPTPVPDIEQEEQEPAGSLAHRAIAAYERQMSAVDKQIQAQMPSQELFVRQRLVAAYGGDPDEWVLRDLAPNENGFWESTWENGEVALGVVRQGQGRDSHLFVDLLGECGDHGFFAAVRNLNPTLETLGGFLSSEVQYDCPVCQLEDTSAKLGLEGDTAELPPEAVIGRVILAHITRTVQAAMRAQVNEILEDQQGPPL